MGLLSSTAVAVVVASCATSDLPWLVIRATQSSFKAFTAGIIIIGRCFGHLWAFVSGQP
jgi:hypothetical protein